MYLSILILPLLGSVSSGLLGRKLGVTGAHLVTCTCLILSSILATIAFWEVGIAGSPVIVELSSWIDSELMNISWEFLFDQLTVAFSIYIISIAGAESVIGLSILVAFYRLRGNISLRT